MKDLLYASVKKHLDTLSSQVGFQNKEAVLKSIKQQMKEQEDKIAAKSLKAIRTLDTRL